MNILVIGCGRFGSNLSKELSDSGHNITVIDRDNERLSMLGSGFNGVKIKGIEYDNEVLMQAGISNADALIAVTPYENINITVSLIAKKIYQVPKIIARIVNPNRQYIYENLKIETISPVELGVTVLKDKLSVTSYHKIISINDEYEFIEIMIKKDKRFTVREFEDKYECIISAIISGGRAKIPNKDEKLMLGDKIYCTIGNKQAERLVPAL